ncbi:MAG: hypothetical protein KDD24_01850, partial [Flavobacteriales bacterium]|nr:hypothetical protein [Flavobacteriales bacterium]
LGFIIAFMLNSTVLKTTKIKSITTTILLLIYGGYFIYNAHIYPTKRVNYLTLLSKNGNKYTNKKFIIHPDDFPWGYSWVRWALPAETLLVSSIKGPNNSITCYLAEYGEKIDVSSNNGQLLGANWMKHLLNANNLDSNYFKIPKNSNYLITNRIDKNIFFVKETIRHNRQWLNEVQKQANENNQTLEKQIHNNAQYNIETRPPSQKIDFIIGKKDLRLTKIENEIKSNSDWMETIKLKAKERGVSVESMVTLDAQYLLSQQKE